MDLSREFARFPRQEGGGYYQVEEIDETLFLRRCLYLVVRLSDLPYFSTFRFKELIIGADCRIKDLLASANGATLNGSKRGDMPRPMYEKPPVRSCSAYFIGMLLKGWFVKQLLQAEL